MDDLNEAALEKAIIGAGQNGISIKPTRVVVPKKFATKPKAGKKVELTNAKDKKAKQPTAKKSARAVTKATKPKKARPPKRPNKPVKVIAKKTAKPAPGPVRSERMDLRLSKKEKALIHAKAKKLRRTLTSLFVEFVEKVK